MGEESTGPHVLTGEKSAQRDNFAHRPNYADIIG